MRVRVALLALLALVLAAGPAVGSQPYVPEPLRTWVPWIVESHPEVACAWSGEARSCAWPGRLTLDLGPRGGSFELSVRVDRAMPFPLPGGAGNWPQAVEVDGRPALLRRRGHAPHVELAAGDHRIAGRFRWLRLPETLPVPPAVALVDLSLPGRPGTQPRRERDGLVWLQARQEEAAEEDRVHLEVFRRFVDGVPGQLETRIALRVSGSAREVDLGQVLPPGFAPVALSGGLPARIGEQGGLRLQLRPGAWGVSVTSIRREPTSRLESPGLPPPWPEDEIWVYEAVPSARVARVSEGEGIDPQRTNLPEDWRGLPAYRVVTGSGLDLVEVRRGAPDPSPDQLEVERKIWLAVDGSQLTVRDTMTGTLHRGGRLEASAPARLGRVELGGQGQVLTLGLDGAAAGVEVREQALRLVGTLVYPRQATLPAVGWNRSVDRLSAVLYLPPGWNLLAAGGVDHDRGSWVARWTLLDLFFLLLIALAGGRVLGRSWGALALVALGLAWHQAWVPRMAWLGLLALLALHRALPDGRARRLAGILEAGLAIVLVIQLVIFVGIDLRLGLFPHLDSPSGFSLGAAKSPPLGRAAAEPMAADEMVAGEAESKMPRREVPSSAPALLYQRSQQRDVQSVVQTGPGVPAWRGDSFYLGWSGPVDEDHRLRLWLLSPAMGLALAAVRVTLLLLLAARLLAVIRRRRDEASPPPPSSGEAPAGLEASLVLGLLLVAGSVRAQTPVAPQPPPDWLAQLEARLLAPPRCVPECVELPRVELAPSGRDLRLVIEAHAAATHAVPLPGPLGSWTPRRVTVDGEAATALRLEPDGFLRLRLEPGVHRVEMVGTVGDSVTLQFPLVPRRVDWQGEGWILEGHRTDQAPSGSLRLLRQRQLETAAEDEVPELAPWVTLERELDLGIPWLVHHRLERHGSLGQPLRVRVPRLAGESVATAGVEVEGAESVVSFAPGETQRVWSSTLEEAPTLRLEAPVGRPYSETWILACSPIWNCRAAGLPPTGYQRNGTWAPSWQPWPGESVELVLTRPEPAPGASSTIDSVEVTIEPGRRVLQGQLEVSIRASQGAELQWRLPSGAELQHLRVNAQDRPVRFEDDTLRFAVGPGSSAVEVGWQQAEPLRWRQRAPALDLGSELTNVSYRWTVPGGRWLLATGGPRWGPVIGFWQYVVVLLLAAALLGRFGTAPLSFRDWFLLGLGLTQVPVVGALIVVGWLLVLGVRPQLGRGTRWRYNFQQLALTIWTVIALGFLYAAIHRGLLLAPEMGVAGADSYGRSLRWFVDRSGGELPRPWVAWAPIWVWRVVMLGWSLWLASRLLRWIRWGWSQLTAADLWRAKRATS